MIQAVIENLNIDAHYIFIVQRSHYEKFHLKYLLNLISPGCDIIQVESKTDGAASTALLAELLIDNDLPLLIANSDQLVEWNSGQTLYSFQSESIDGAILVFESTHPKWSYVKVSENGLITEVAEKKVISNIATVGIYYWKKGSDFVKFAHQMIKKNIRTNNEFYICPVFNEAIESGLKIRPLFVERMWGIGTPEDLNTYLKLKGQ
jgi:dTDP-glucose pyrophosphorylase